MEKTAKEKRTHLRNLIAKDAKWAMVEGQPFLRLKDAAKLAGIHPVVLEMGKELLSKIGGQGAAFALATPDLQKHAEEIGKAFKTGLKRYAKAMEPDKRIAVKGFKDGQRLVFWYTGS